jgi:SAM-dependent methyltransferase
MEKQSARGCPVCAHGVGEALHSQRFVLPAGHPLGDGYDVVACRRCGFVFADTAATQADYDRFYADYSKYTDDKTATGGGNDPLDARRLRDTGLILREHFPDRAARLVDVGCANGGLLVQLRELGYSNVCGVDPSPACAANARRAGVEAHVGALDALPAAVGPCDGVILSHVLEHVRDLRAALKAVRSVLRPAGRVYVEVPDAARYADFVPSPFQDFNTEHINHFSHHSLDNLRAAAGFGRVARGDRVLETSPGMPYPAIYQVWSFAPQASHSPEGPIPDTGLRRSIDEYIRKSRRLLEAIDRRIRAAVPADGPILVWGVGQLAMKLLAETALGRADIAAFVDSNPVHHGKAIRGIRILAPEAVRDLLAHPILITTTLHERAIARQATETLRLPNRLILLGKVLAEVS